MFLSSLGQKQCMQNMMVVFFAESISLTCIQ